MRVVWGARRAPVAWPAIRTMREEYTLIAASAPDTQLTFVWQIQGIWGVNEDAPEGRWTAELYRLQGELVWSLASAPHVEAEICFQQALAVAPRQQAKAWELCAAICLAYLWQCQGRRTEARALLAP